MEAYSLNKESSAPLYYQLKNVILDLVETGQLQPGDQLPSERELGELYDISRQTVRQAINELELRGVLTRQPGKGTYVAPRKVTQDLLHVTSFTRLILDWGKTTSVKMMACEEMRAPHFVHRLLDLGDDATVVFYERVRIVDDEPVAIHRSYVPSSLGKPLLRISLDSQSLLGLLTELSGVRIRRSQETMEPTVADRYEADMLGIDEGAPLQLITGRLLSEAGNPVECHKSLYRGDKFQFAFEGQLDEVPEP